MKIINYIKQVNNFKNTIWQKLLFLFGVRCSFWIVKTYSYSRYDRGWQYLTENNDWSLNKDKAKRFKHYTDRHKNIYERWEKITL